MIKLLSFDDSICKNNITLSKIFSTFKPIVGSLFFNLNVCINHLKSDSLSVIDHQNLIGGFVCVKKLGGI